MTYSNTNEKLYDDIALWEKTGGKDLFLEMPLKEKQSPNKYEKGDDQFISFSLFQLLKLRKTGFHLL